MTPEGELKTAVLAFLNKTGEWFIRMNSGKAKVRGGYIQMAPNGTADLLVMRSVPHWIEIKKPGKDTTSKSRAEKQSEFRDKVLSLGHKHVTAKSLQDVQEFLGGSK